MHLLRRRLSAGATPKAPSSGKTRSVRGVIFSAVVFACLALTACGGSQSWKDEFTSEVEGVIDSTERVSEGTRSVTQADPQKAWTPYLRFGKELTAAKERLEELEDAPSGCTKAEVRALGEVRREHFTAFALSGPGRYPPTLMKAVEDQKYLREIEALLRSVLSDAHCN
jgi:hypothetical protein